MASKVAGMEVPEEIVARIEKTPKAAQPAEGIRVCVEIIEQVREIPGVAGVHIMAVHWAEAVPEIVTQAGLYPRPPRALAPVPEQVYVTEGSALLGGGA
jgi:methylenetetrahydrofolate reductase (NADPH)